MEEHTIKDILHGASFGSSMHPDHTPINVYVESVSLWVYCPDLPSYNILFVEGLLSWLLYTSFPGVHGAFVHVILSLLK